MDNAVLVEQQVEAHLADNVLGQFAIACFLLFCARLVDGIVVIAQNGIDAIMGQELTEIEHEPVIVPT